MIVGAGLVSIVVLFGRGGQNGAVPNQLASAGDSLRGAQGNAQSAPDFSLPKLGGGTISLADYKGKKPVVLDFWASWCPNCRRNMPHLNALYQTYKGKIEVIGVNLQEDPGTVQQFIATRGISYPIALDQYSQASQAYGIRYTNTHVLIDKNGNAVRAIPGDIQESDITSLISG